MRNNERKIIMLKKTLGIALLMASLSVTAFAAIPKDSMHIGGLKPGMTIEQVAAMYGQPVFEHTPFKAEGDVYHIGGGLLKGWQGSGMQGVFSSFYLNGSYKPAPGVDKVLATGDVHIGMSISEVVSRLGSPDKTFSFQNGRHQQYRYESVENVDWTWNKKFTMYFEFQDGILTDIGLNHFYP